MGCYVSKEKVNHSFNSYHHLDPEFFTSLLVDSADSSPCSGNDNDDSDEENEKSGEEFVELPFKSSSMSGPLGEWEEHTKVYTKFSFLSRCNEMERNFLKQFKFPST